VIEDKYMLIKALQPHEFAGGENRIVK